MTADLVQDHDLRREIKLWVESQDSQKESLDSQKQSRDTQEQTLDSLQLPDPVPIQTKESDSVTLVDIPECPVKAPENPAAVENNEDAFPDNTESEDEITFQGITFSADVQKPVIESDHTEEADVVNVDDSSDGVVGDISDAAAAAVTTLPEVDEEVVPEEIDEVPFSEKTEQQLIDDTISTLIGSKGEAEKVAPAPVEATDTVVNADASEEATETISSDTIALLFDNQQASEEKSPQPTKSPLKISLKQGFNKLNNLVPVVKKSGDTENIDKELEIFEKPVVVNEIEIEPSVTATIETETAEEDDVEECPVIVKAPEVLTENVEAPCVSAPLNSQLGSWGGREADYDYDIMDDSQQRSEVRTIKMVDEEDANAFEKINKIKEEINKTKSVSSRRKSAEEPKKPSIKPFEVKPITNALQGLQALLKMSKPPASTSEPSSTLTVQPEKKKPETEKLHSKVKSRSSSRDRDRVKKSKERDSGRSRERRSSSRREISPSLGGSSSKSRSSSRRSERRDSTSDKIQGTDSRSHRSSRNDDPSTSRRSRSRSKERRSRRNSSRDKSTKESSSKSSNRRRSRSSSPRSSRSVSKKDGGRDRKSRHGKPEGEVKKISVIPLSESFYQPTKINRSAVIRDAQVETESKTLAQDLDQAKEEEVKPESSEHSEQSPPSEPPKPQPDSKFNSAQMDSIRKTLLTDSGKVKKSLADRELEDDIKVRA